ncbi:hypothetical protein AB4K20DRAFT_1588716 [Rhizopus microsporus]
MGVLAALTFLIPRLLLVDPSRLISESVGMAFLSFCFLQQQLTSLSLFLCSLSSANFSLCASPDQDGAPLLLPSTPERSTTDVQCTLSGYEFSPGITSILECYSHLPKVMTESRPYCIHS